MIDIEILSSQVDVDIAEPVIKAGSYRAGEYIQIINNEISVVTSDTIEEGDHGPVSSDAVFAAFRDLVIDVDNIPTATTSSRGLVKASDAEDGVLVALDGTMTVNSLDINKIYQPSDTDVVLFSGGSEY